MLSDIPQNTYLYCPHNSTQTNGNYRWLYY